MVTAAVLVQNGQRYRKQINSRLYENAGQRTTIHHIKVACWQLIQPGPDGSVGHKDDKANRDYRPDVDG